MGRPPKYPRGMPRTAAAYKAASRAALRERGGRILSVELEAETVAALEALRAPGESDAALIRRLIHGVRG